MTEAEEQNRRYRFGEFVVDELRGALQRNGEDVALRPKSWGVLRQLVMHAGELVTKETLLDAVWRDRVVSEGVVAKSVREIRLALGDEARDVVRTVPRRGYLFDAPVTVEAIEEDDREEAVGPPISSGPDRPETVGQTRPADTRPSKPPGPPTSSRGPVVARLWRRGAAAAALLAAVAVVWSMALRAVDSTPRAADGSVLVPPERSIAVLPFDDMSPEGDQQYLADGMAEEILNLLAMSKELKVIARTSSFALRDEPVDAVMIGHRLNVTYLLEGSLRRSGDDLRVAVQLVDGRDGTRVWTASYDRALGDTLALQSEIASSVSNQLHVRLAASGDRRPIDPVAYQRYMEARFRFNRRLDGDLLRAEELFLEATRIDPDFARAWAGLAGVYWVRSNVMLDDSIRLSEPEALEAMALPIERALQADPDLAEAHVRASIYHSLTGTPERARDHLARARELAPNHPLVLASLTWHVGESDVPEDQIVVYRKIVAADPLSLAMRNNLIYFLIQDRRLAEARRELEAALSLFPSATGEFAYYAALIELLDGDPEKAAAAAETLPEETERLYERTALLAMAWDGMGLIDQSVEARTRLERAPGEWAALRVAEIHAYSGAVDQAYAWLREALQRASPEFFYRWSFWEQVDDSLFLHQLKDDSRWRSLEAEIETLSSNL